MKRRLFFTRLAATVALLAASPISGRAVAPPKWVVSRWWLEKMNWGRSVGVGVEVASGNETRRHAVSYDIHAKSDFEWLHANAKRRLSDWVDNLNGAQV